MHSILMRCIPVALLPVMLMLSGCSLTLPALTGADQARAQQPGFPPPPWASWTGTARWS